MFFAFSLHFVHTECTEKDEHIMKTRRKEILGDILRRERTVRKISQETLGNVAGIGKTTVSTLLFINEHCQKPAMYYCLQCSDHKKKTGRVTASGFCFVVACARRKHRQPIRRKLKREF
jgi:hypothetical protein